MDSSFRDPAAETRADDHAGHAARRPVSRRRLIAWFVAVAVLLALVLGGLYAFNRFRQNAIAEFFASNRPPPTPVAAVEAETVTMPVYLTGIGSLAAVRQVVVSPEVGGRVTEIMFQPGADVRAGDPLVQLNDAPERATLQGLRAQARLAELNLARAKELQSRQFSPQATVDQLQAELAQARADIQRTEAIIAQKLIRAPFAGKLGVRQVNLGEYVNPGDPIATLTDLDTLYVNFTLPEQTRSRLSVGQTVEVTNDAYPGRLFEAKLTTIEPQVNVDTRTISLQARMDNQERLLLPGMFAYARVVLPPEPNVVTVPETAVDYTLYGDSVFLIEKTGETAEGKPAYKAVRTFVETGERFDNRVEILSGVEPGDLVATSGQIKLNNGAAVTLDRSSALATPAAVPMH